MSSPLLRSLFLLSSLTVFLSSFLLVPSSSQMMPVVSSYTATITSFSPSTIGLSGGALLTIAGVGFMRGEGTTATTDGATIVYVDDAGVRGGGVLHHGQSVRVRSAGVAHRRPRARALASLTDGADRHRLGDLRRLPGHRRPLPGSPTPPRRPRNSTTRPPPAPPTASSHGRATSSPATSRSWTRASAPSCATSTTPCTPSPRSRTINSARRAGRRLLADARPQCAHDGQCTRRPRRGGLLVVHVSRWPSSGLYTLQCQVQEQVAGKYNLTLLVNPSYELTSTPVLGYGYATPPRFTYRVDDDGSQPYTFVQVPTVTSISPAVGGTAGGGLVTIYGTSFGTDCTAVQVTLAGAAAQTVSCTMNAHGGAARRTDRLPQALGVRADHGAGRSAPRESSPPATAARRRRPRRSAASTTPSPSPATTA